MMNASSPLETRIGALISAYADRAPADVDPTAMARLAARARRSSVPIIFGPGQPGLRLGLILLALALAITTAAGALVAGRAFEHEPEEFLSGPVAPFQGLPPVGAAPSTPETGELVLRSGARIVSIGGDVHQMWLFADGRLIWGRSLEGDHDAAWRSAFGRTEPLERAMMEQRLTSDGVSLFLSHVVASTTRTEPVEWPGCVAPPEVCRGPGLIWGGIAIKDGDRMQDVSWSDPDLPGRLADPGSWLPSSAWADREIRGYVPTRYAACPQPGVLDLLPAAARDILLTRGTRMPADPEDAACYSVETADVRAIAEILDRAGFPRADHHSLLEYQVPRDSTDWRNRIAFTPMTPNGDMAGWGG
jgi:hypothetical protein